MRAVIIGGAEIKNYDFVKQQLLSDDFFIVCDKGLNHIEKLGIVPSLIIGDFDSHTKPSGNVLSYIETIVLPCEKDDTDTIYAVKEVIKRKFTECIIIGAVAERLDHSLANVYSLLMLNDANVNSKIIDDYSIIEIVDNKKIIDANAKYFSLLNIDGSNVNVTIKNAKYELSNASIKTHYQYAVCNEVIAGKVTSIDVTNGKLLLITIYYE